MESAPEMIDWRNLSDAGIEDEIHQIVHSVSLEGSNEEVVDRMISALNDSGYPYSPSIIVREKDATGQRTVIGMVRSVRSGKNINF